MATTGPPAAPRVIVYVDGFNLYYGCLKRTPHKWLDLGRLCELLLPGADVVRINYYTARINARPGKISSPNDQQIYLRALRTVPRLSITLGHFLTHSVPMRLSNVFPIQRVWVDKTEEKGSDVNIAAHLVRDACQSRFDTAVVISGDSDLAEPIRIVRDEVGLKIGVVSPREHHSADLRRVATFLKRIRQGHLVAAQFPPVLRDAKGEFHKPPSW
jgi:uncharacterized LabA/DUF88 family protein